MLFYCQKIEEVVDEALDEAYAMGHDVRMRPAALHLIDDEPGTSTRAAAAGAARA